MTNLQILTNFATWRQASIFLILIGARWLKASAISQSKCSCRALSSALSSGVNSATAMLPRVDNIHRKLIVFVGKFPLLRPVPKRANLREKRMHKPHVLTNPGSANAANNTAITNFITAFNAPLHANPTPVQIQAKVATLLLLFSPDAVAPVVPSVGITNHGWNFQLVAGVTLLFTQLFTSFPDLTLNEENGVTPRLYSLDSYAGLPTISVTTSLRGSYLNAWFPKTGAADSSSHYSKPLSDIAPQANNPQVLKGRGIPAISVFGLNVTNPAAPLISLLSIYMDRYKFESDLKPGVT